jgi:hypothetical protein
MKTWQIFGVGTLVLIAMFLGMGNGPALAGLAALAIVAVVTAGFLVSPSKQVFYIRTTNFVVNADRQLCIEHDRIAVRVELTRLWLLFVPTFAAVAWLVVMLARGLWGFRTIADPAFDPMDSYPYLFAVEISGGAVLTLISAWMHERWMLRDAEACSARTSGLQTRTVKYSFQDPDGQYYGGYGLRLGPLYPRQLANLVLYARDNPDLNKMAVGCLFHKPVIIGHGLTDLDEATAARPSAWARLRRRRLA